MFRLNSSSTDRKPSRTGSKGGLKAIVSRLKPELHLAVDTDVSRYRGGVPEQVFPYETGSQSRSRDAASTLSRKKSTKPTGLRRQLENRDGLQAGLVRSGSVNAQLPSSYAGLPSRPDVNRTNSKTASSLAAPVLHGRVRGLRPSPLHLTDISPSDRAIPIGIAIPSASISDHTTSPLTATHRNYSPPQYGREATTPTIVITPAKEDFDLTPPSYLPHGAHGHRPASSLYSRYTNCAPRTADCVATPPVPPLPLFAQQPRKQTVAESKLPVYEEGRNAISHKATLSVCTVFEEDEQSQPPMSARSFSGYRLRSIKRQSTLPTPRRSRGWWNVITSPFSARSNGLLWKSPTDEDLDRTTTLSDASAMGIDGVSRGDLYRSDVPVDEIEPHSAPASRVSTLPGAESRSVPKRSVTAPGAMDPNGDVVNIYRIPSQGAAAAYYDQSKHFPSLLVDPADAVPRSMFEDDSPLTDVCACERHRHGHASDDKGAAVEIDETKRASTCSRHSTPIKGGAVIVADALKSPFDDSHAIEDRSGPPQTPPRTIFSSPTADELLSPSPVRHTPDRSQTSATTDSRMSVVSSTPVIEDAHVATVVGPRSSNGEQREVIIPPSRASSPPNVAGGLQAATMASREVAEEPVQTAPYSNTRPPMHSREDSRGLGISNSQQDLFPPPKLLSEKPRLGTDRFGQLVILSEKKEYRPAQPWYKRFFWLLVTACVSLLLLLIVLLVVFIPQTHADNGVQAQWLNLTGFPPLPTGVATVIQPKKTFEQSNCIAAPLWTCAAPKAQLAPDSTSDLPNFRLEIRFRNHTLGNATASLPASNHSSSGPASVQSHLRRARSIWSETLYSPNPPPPSKADQLALGASADNVSAPYNGEETPFYLSLLNPEPIPHISKRSETDTETETEIPNPYPYPTPSNTTSSKTAPGPKTNTKIPSPPTKHSQTQQLLYPFATAQPLRLYNRGREDEHYGFYTYFSKSVLVANASSSNTTTTTNQTSPLANLTALPNSSDKAKAQAVCTFAQTRLRVQVWTRRQPVSSLNAAAAGTSVQAADSTANEMVAPGSFPLAVSFSLDREAGPQGEEGRGVFCWALDGEGGVVGEGVRVEEKTVEGGGLEGRDESGNGKCGCGWGS